MEETPKRRSRVQLRKDRKKKIITIIRTIILFIILLILAYMFYGIYQENKVRTFTSERYQENDLTDDLINEMENKQIKTIVKPSIPVSQKYLGYEVDGRLEIPKISLNTNVLSKYSTQGLEVCASKYYGPKPNEVGNYCIAGHNYNKENMFNHLIDLKIDDTVILTDNENGIVEYKIYDIYKVKPQNTEPLSQQTKGKRELTLVTCVNYSKNRLVIKAAEK